MLVLPLQAKKKIMNTINEITAATKSAIGAENIMPSTPSKPIFINIIGNITNNGSKNIICLVSDKNVPLLGSPITVQNVDVIGCIPFKNVINKNILKNFSANIKYSLEPEPNIPIICLGNN